MLLWLMCGRKGDAARLLVQDVIFGEENRVDFFVQEGKGVLARKEKYHVTSEVPQQWRSEIEAFIQKQKNASYRYLFRRSLKSSGEANQALRLANPQLSTRAVRRGALQTLAQSKDVDLQTVMKMAGHKNTQTTLRYLGWGKINEKEKRTLQQAARLLAPALPPSPQN